MAYPSHVARGALRHALRTHPDRNTVLNGNLVNSLTLDELKAALTKLGIDPVQLVLNATNGQTPIEPSDTAEDTAPMPNGPDTPDAIETELQSIRSLIMTGGFSSLDDKLRQLVIDAHKPAVTVIERVEIQVPVDVVPGARPIHTAKQTGASETWHTLFGVTGTMASRTTAIWDGTHPDTPKVNDRYLWPHPQTETALSQLARGRNVMLYGPAGTGKTEWAQQLAARTGRPFALISCDTGTDASTLVGMTVPDASGGVTWQDGQLTRAIQTPGCVICLELAQLLVSAATVTRAAADNQQLSHGIGLRRLLAWSELLQDGVDAEYAFQSAVLNCAAEQDVETLREQCLLAYDHTNVARALKGKTVSSDPADPSVTNPSPAGRAAAASFTTV